MLCAPHPPGAPWWDLSGGCGCWTQATPLPRAELLEVWVSLGGSSRAGGGSILSKRCFCPTPLDSPPQTVSAQMEMTVTVTSMEYSKDLEDRDSEKFQNFSAIFTKEVSLGMQVPAGHSALPESSLEVKKAGEGCSHVRGL